MASLEFDRSSRRYHMRFRFDGRPYKRSLKTGDDREAQARRGAGVTAAFNRNLLLRINRELDADFDSTIFRHHAFYNEDLSRIEMHLISLREQQVRIGDRSFHFRKGESIHTENSYKYDIREFIQRAASCGFRTDQIWTDDAGYFAVLYLTASGALNAAL